MVIALGTLEHLADWEAMRLRGAMRRSEMEAKAPYQMNDATKRAQERAANLGNAHRDLKLSALYDKEFAPSAAVKRLRDMNGVEVSMVAAAMDTLGIMQIEARALMRVSLAVGPDRVLKKVMKKDEFVEVCSAG